MKDKITKASENTNARFKRKKIRSMKREANKKGEKLGAPKAKLESAKPRVTIDPLHGAPFKLHPPNRSKRIETNIAKLTLCERRARKVDNAELPRPTAGEKTRQKNINLFPRAYLGNHAS